MNEDFQKIYYRFPKLLIEFVKIKNSTDTVRQAIGAITETLQKEMNLYQAILRTVEGDFLIVDSVFGTDEREVQNCLRHSHPINISEINSKNAYAVCVQSRKLLIISAEREPNPIFFYGTPFPLSASWIFFPIKKEGKFFYVIELGSKKIISSPKYKNDNFISKVLKLPFEILMHKINDIVNSKIEND